jgi:topoisomerase-4 subunit B
MADSSIDKVLSYYMGKNTPERQEFIIDNLVIERDIEEESEPTETVETETAA